jgi:putative flippase GtrA
MPDQEAEPSWRKRSGFSAEFARFVLVGMVNTGIGYGVIWLALPLIGYQPAYALGYVVGIVVAYLLNSRFVFRRPLSIGTAFRYPIVYLVQYGFGAIVLQVLVNRFGIAPRLATLFALVASVPVSFILNRMVLAIRASPQE